MCGTNAYTVHVKLNKDFFFVLYVKKALSTVWVQSMLLSLLNVTCVSSGSFSFVSSGM